MFCIIIFNANAAEPIRGSVEINGNIFKVELARSTTEMQRGLMFRDHIADDGGMLFIHPYPRNLSMWMKNTNINLDMLFVNQQRKIIKIHQATKHDLTPINSPSPAKYVLEIKGGLAQKLGLKIGDKLILCCNIE